MKLTIKGTFYQNERQIDTRSLTLSELLKELSKAPEQEAINFFNPESGQLLPIYTVFLNGKPYDTLAEGLDTRLSDGDEVKIYLTLVTGG